MTKTIKSWPDKNVCKIEKTV